MHCCVYWLFDAGCSLPEKDGYVGITNNLRQRLREHKSKGRIRWSGVAILFEGTLNECIAKEMNYRPHPGMGWNSNSGGTSGKMLSDATREKFSRWQKGRKLPATTRKKMRLAHKRRSPEEKARLAKLFGELAIGNKSRTGQKFSVEERAKLSAAQIGNKNAVGNKNAAGSVRSKEFREAVSERMKGKRIRLGAKLTDEQRANISAGRKGKGLGNQNWRKRKSVSAQP